MYDYQKEKAWTVSEEGQKQFLRIRDRVNSLLETAGAVRLDKAISSETGSSWEMMACVDRLVELGELKELTNKDVPGQYRVFVKSY